MLAIEVLMQAIVIAGAIAQQKRCRTRLSSLVAALQESAMHGRKPGLDLHRLVPAVGDGSEVGVERLAQLCDAGWQRISKISIFAAPETMTRHHDRAAEPVLVVVRRSDAAAFRRCE